MTFWSSQKRALIDRAHKIIVIPSSSIKHTRYDYDLQSSCFVAKSGWSICIYKIGTYITIRTAILILKRFCAISAIPRFVKNFKKAEGRRQRAEGIPITKVRGFNKDVVFLALRVSKYIFSLFFINKFRGFKPSGIGQIKNLSSLLPSALCPLPFFGKTP